MTSTQTAAQFQAQPPASGLTLVETERPSALQVVGVSAAWRKLLMQAEMAAPHIQVATIEGEHGCGKQTLARYLFSRSTLAQTTFQSRDAREWLVSEADPSTLAGFTYLDRVDLLAPPGQGLLLRVLKAIQDRPIGRAVLLASSQTSLRQMAGQGLLMPDLAYRLTAVRLAIPPLRQRREDLAPLAQCLLDRICARYQQRPVILGPGALARLLQHNWPGNVRELTSVLETALLEAENGVIHAAGLVLVPSPEKPGGPGPVFGTWDESSLRATGGPGSAFGPWEPTPLQAESLNLDSVVRRHVQSVLDLNRGNKLRAARQLGISRSTLYRILGDEAVLAH